MAEISIIRRKQLFAPMNCCFHVFIDGDKKTTLSNGDRDQLIVKEGKYQVHVKNNYFTSRKVLVVVNNEKVTKLETFGNPFVGWLYLIAPLILLAYATLRFFHVTIPGITPTVALVPLLLFVVLAALMGLLKMGVIVKEL